MSKTQVCCGNRAACRALARWITPRWLRPRDEPTVAIWLGVAACGIAFSWLRGGGLTGEWVRMDAAERVPYALRIDLNRADWPELTLLPGISRTIACRIVSHRHAVGPFRSIDELLRVPGIGPKTVARLRPWLDVGRPVPSAAWPSSAPATPAAAHAPQ